MPANSWRAADAWAVPGFPRRGLYLSFVLRPQAPVSQVPHLSLVVALGVLHAVRTLGLKAVALKWPNDVVMEDGAKLCGILLELFAQVDRVDAIIVGIGLNVDRSKLAPVGSAYLSDQLGELNLARVAALVIDGVLDCYRAWQDADFSFAPFAQDYVNDLLLVGSDVCVHRLDGTVEAEGTVRGIDGEGCLIVGDKHVVAGDVTLRS